MLQMMIDNKNMIIEMTNLILKEIDISFLLRVIGYADANPKVDLTK